MRAGVAIAADDRHPRLRQSKLWADYMDNPLIRRVHVEQPHTKFFAVGLQCGNLFSGNKIGDGSSARLRRNIVVDCGHGACRLPDFSTGSPQPIERLRRGHLMHQMQIDVDNRRPAAGLRHQVRIPNLFEKCLLRWHEKLNHQFFILVQQAQGRLPRIPGKRIEIILRVSYNKDCSFTPCSPSVLCVKGFLMINGKRIAVVMPAYNAEKTLEATVGELPDLVDIRILVDDHSSDNTVELARHLGLLVFQHDRNYGYGRNQQTCYREALAAGADVVIMLHPDYQYTPLLSTAMASMVACDVYDVVLGSRIIGGTALRGGMPVYKYVFNRLLTAFENIFLRVKLSEYHTGYRAFSRRVLTELPLLENSDDFVFDNQMLAQCVHFGFHIGEVSCPTKYFEEASSINFRRSVKYGFGVLATTLQFALQKSGLLHFPRFSEKGRRLDPGYTAYYESRTETAPHA